MSAVIHKTVEEFRKAVVVESDKLTAYSTQWKEVLELNKDLAEEIVGDIMVAVGQAELLKKERFTQFRGLIDNCEFKRGEMETTIGDLQGFWDIVYFQIDDIVEKFNNLKKLQENKWVKETVVLPKQKLIVKKTVPVKKPVVKSSSTNGSKPKGVSALRAHMLAARSKLNVEESKKPLAQVNGNKPVNVKVSSPLKENKEKSQPQNVTRNSPLKVVDKENVPKTPKDAKKDLKLEGESKNVELSTFDAGFFKVETPSKSKLSKNSSAPLTPTRNGSDMNLTSSLLKARTNKTPKAHKDYSPCMRITRSMKKIALEGEDSSSQQKSRTPARCLKYADK